MSDLFDPVGRATAETAVLPGLAAGGQNPGVVGAREIAIYGRADDEWYVEPGWCVDLLLAVAPFAGSVWDPACGCGTIPKAFARIGQSCIGSDLRDRGYGTAPIDFLRRQARYGGADTPDNIVCNPPYGHGRSAEAFIRHALAIARRKVAMLVNEKFLYSQGRHDLFTSAPWGAQSLSTGRETAGGAGTRPTRLWFLSSRPSMPPGELLASGAVEPKGGTMNYLWIVWERDRAPEPPGWLIRDRKTSA